VGAFEAMTGPLYLGPALAALLVRLAVDGGTLFGGVAPPALVAAASPPPSTRPPIDGVVVARIASDVTPDRRHVAEEIADALGLDAATVSPADRALIRDAAACLLRRAARLTAAGVAGVLKHIAAARSGGVGVGALADRLVIAADGAMLRRGGRFQDELRQGLDDVLGADAAARVDLTVPDGGPCLGAAALAAAAAGAAAAMGTADLVDGAAVTFPPRAAGATPVPPPRRRG
jgi:hexokinase